MSTTNNSNNNYNNSSDSNNDSDNSNDSSTSTCVCECVTRGNRRTSSPGNPCYVSMRKVRCPTTNDASHHIILHYRCYMVSLTLYYII